MNYAKIILYLIAAVHAALGLYLTWNGFDKDIKEIYMPKLDRGSKFLVIAGGVLLFLAIVMAAATYFA